MGLQYILTVIRRAPLMGDVRAGIITAALRQIGRSLVGDDVPASKKNHRDIRSGVSCGQSAAPASP